MSNIKREITQNKTKHLLVENGLNKLQTFDSSHFIGKSHFDEDSTQSYLVFQPINKYCKVITNTDYVSSWKAKGLSAEIIKPPATSDNSLTPALNYYGTKTRAKFTGSCLNNQTFHILMEISKYLHCNKYCNKSCNKSNKYLHCLSTWCI